MPDLDGSPVSLTDDAFHSLGELLGLRSVDAVLLEGFIEAQTFAAVVLYGPRTTPPTTAGGQNVSAATGRTYGPVRNLEAGWALNRFWIRNAAAGSNTTITATGKVEYR